MIDTLYFVCALTSFTIGYRVVHCSCFRQQIDHPAEVFLFGFPTLMLIQFYILIFTAIISAYKKAAKDYSLAAFLSVDRNTIHLSHPYMDQKMSLR